MVGYKGATYTASGKQKLNTKISTEAEMVAINNAMAQVLWTRNFLAAQCMYIPTTTIYQDNKSTILLTEKGRQKQSLNERYFLLWSSWYLHNA